MLNEPQACVESNFLNDNAPVHKSKLLNSISSRKALKLCHTLSNAWILLHVNFCVCCFGFSKSLLGPGHELNACSAPRSTVFWGVDHTPKEDYKHTFNNGYKDKRSVLLLRELICLTRVKGFKSVVSFILEIPSYHSPKPCASFVVLFDV